MIGRILVVEDHPAMLYFLADFLALEGHTVTTATSGQDALALAQQQAFDLVLSDICMPSMDGFTLCQQLQQQQNIPVLLMTSLSPDEVVADAAAVGASGLLFKPFSLAALQQQVQRQLQNQASHSPSQLVLAY